MIVLITLLIIPPNAFQSYSANGPIAKQNSELFEEIDELTNDDAEEDVTVAIDENEQDRLLKEAGQKCHSQMKRYHGSINFVKINSK